MSAIHLLNVGYCGSRHVDHDGKCDCNLQSCFWSLVQLDLLSWRRVALRLVMGDGVTSFADGPARKLAADGPNAGTC